MKTLQGPSSNSLSQGTADGQPNNDEERRKQADTRRPMLFRKMIMFDMDERVDLDNLLRKQLGGIPKDFHDGIGHREQESDGGTGIEEDGRRRN